jgi:hypothetical protein
MPTQTKRLLPVGSTSGFCWLVVPLVFIDFDGAKIHHFYQICKYFVAIF